MSAKPYEYLSARERERLRNRIAQEKRRLGGDIVVHRHANEGNPERRLGQYAQFMDERTHDDPGPIRERIRRAQKALDAGTPGELTNTEKMRLERQATRDREFLRKKMANHRLFYMKPTDPEFQNAVNACKVEHSSEYSKVANRYKNTMRQLDPENPDAANIERLRPKS